jgi:hypothetical protein
VRGLVLVDWSATGYGTDAARAAIDALAGTGANAVAILITTYQPTIDASAVTADDPRTPHPDAVAAATDAARTRGLAVTFKPHVDVDDGSWRAYIEPADVDAWFRSYAAFLLPWAGRAERAGARRFVVGTELRGLARDAARWRVLVASVRGVFSGEIVYGADWSDADDVPFWDVLDAVGVDVWFPVATTTTPTVRAATDAWQPRLTRYAALARRTGLPVLFTEIGYRSADGTGAAPFDFDAPGSADENEQALLYGAALDVTRGLPWLAGMFFWNWPADGGDNPRVNGYSPRGKAAEGVLRAAWRAD